MLKLIKAKVSSMDNDRIKAIPLDEEIKECIFAFKKEKAPGEDGLTAEVLQICWPFAKKLCCDAVRAFWVTKNVNKKNRGWYY